MGKMEEVERKAWFLSSLVDWNENQVGKREDNALKEKSNPIIS